MSVTSESSYDQDEAGTHAGAQAASKSRWLSFGICALPLAFFAYCAFIEPRPFYLEESDLDVAYWIDAKLIHSGRPVWNLNDPGTPIQYLGAAVLALVGDAPERVPGFIAFTTLLANVLTAASLFYFLRWSMREPGRPRGDSRLVVLSLLTLVTFPPVFAYANYFGAASFTLALGLPSLFAFWMSLSANPRRT